MELKPYTYEEILAIIGSTATLQERTQQQIEKNEQKFQERLETSEQKFQERLETSEQKFQERLETSEQKFQERFERNQQQLELYKQENAESRRLLDIEMRKLARKVGDITDTLGKFAQEQVRPRLIEMFREKGVYMEEIHHNVVVEKEGIDYLEIDLLLVNTIYSVVVEVKNTLKQKDVDEHIERLVKLQESPSRSIKGTKMYAAVAGMIVNKEVEKYAIRKGLFLVKPKGDSVEISNDATFKPKTWAVKS